MLKTEERNEQVHYQSESNTQPLIAVQTEKKSYVE